MLTSGLTALFFGSQLTAYFACWTRTVELIASVADLGLTILFCENPANFLLGLSLPAEVSFVRGLPVPRSRPQRLQ